MKYNCALTVDCVIRKDDGVVLIKRKFPLFKGEYALPGGFVEENETVEEACRREVLEETGVKLGKLKFVGAYATPGRDPRGRTVTFAFTATDTLENLRAGDDAAEAELVREWRELSIAFDHKRIIQDALL